MISVLRAVACVVSFSRPRLALQLLVVTLSGEDLSDVLCRVAERRGEILLTEEVSTHFGLDGLGVLDVHADPGPGVADVQALRKGRPVLRSRLLDFRILIVGETTGM